MSALYCSPVHRWRRVHVSYNPPVPLHPAHLCQVTSQDVVEPFLPSPDSLLSRPLLLFLSVSLSPCHRSPNLPLLCRMLLNIFYMYPPLSFTSHSVWSSRFSLLSFSLWSAHRMLSSISCHRGCRKEAKRSSVWCAISSNSLHLDWSLHRLSSPQKCYSFPCSLGFPCSILPRTLFHTTTECVWATSNFFFDLLVPLNENKPQLRPFFASAAAALVICFSAGCFLFCCLSVATKGTWFLQLFERHHGDEKFWLCAVRMPSFFTPPPV